MHKDQNKKCDGCKKPAVYLLSNANPIKCKYCKHVKYESADLKLKLCDLGCIKCEWDLTEIVSQAIKNITVWYSIGTDKCECCGKKDFSTVLFNGKYAGSKHKCNFCRDPVRYRLTNVDEIVCTKCNYIVHSEGEYQVDICSTRCNKMMWTVDEYLTDVNSSRTQLIYHVKKFKCSDCGKIFDAGNIMFEGGFEGQFNGTMRLSKYGRNYRMYRDDDDY